MMRGPHFIDEQDIRIRFSRLPEDVLFEHNVRVAMRDGVALSANVFRPSRPGRYPVLMAVSPYGKDQFDQYTIQSNIPRVHLGEINLSDRVAFEAPDPGFWVPQGYVVIEGDTRGQGQSDGDTGPFHQKDREDYFDLIEWAAAQPWSNGRVGLSGVSYLCVSQWAVAAMRPPHLAAIVPWEGWNDYYRRFYFGGIPEVGFMGWLWNGWIKGNKSASSSGYLEENILENVVAHPTNDDYWRQFDCDLSRIDVPALVCASFSDQGLHTRDTFEGFKKIGSVHKWLFNHRRPKWASYYRADALDWQKRFLDYYLKDEGAGLINEPPVRLEINETRETYTVMTAESWPPPDMVPFVLHLDGAIGSMSSNVPAESQISYPALGGGASSFDWTFSDDTDLIGNSRLRLWISTDSGNDMDVYVALRKIDRQGNEVFFYGFGNDPNEAVSLGWLRVSHRELDSARTTQTQPWLKHDRQQKVAPGDVVPVDIELLPAAVRFRSGERLRVFVQGTKIDVGSSLFAFGPTVNSGTHTIHTGGRYDSTLTFPSRPIKSN